MLAGNDETYLDHNSTFALNADTRKFVWYYQHIVDHWDFDHPFERLLVDTVVVPDPTQVVRINPKLKPGERRKVVTGIPGKTGIILRARLPNRRIPVGHADGRAECGFIHRRRYLQSHRESRRSAQPMGFPAART